MSGQQGKRNRKRGKKGNNQDGGAKQQQQPQQQQKKQQKKQQSQQKGGPKKAQGGNKGKGGKQQQQREKVSSGNRRKRKSSAASKQQKIDKAQARLELIIRSKYQNPSSATPTKLESRVCQLLVDLEASHKDLKPHLRDLGIVSVKEVLVTPTKKALLIVVPFDQHVRWKKLQERVVRELEKKFSDQDVIFIAQRKIMKLCQINPKVNTPRPRTQTITAVQKEILNDIVFPTQIVGKRTRFRVGGGRLLKVYLDPKDSKDIEARLPTFEAVYRKMTRKSVKFLFPRYVI